jgi:glycosyltransferase involved in cell wall biosynthesis
MFCSVVIPTIGRDTLARAVRSVLEQDFSPDECEVVVVNDSGKPLRESAWLQQDRCRVIDTNRRERSFARNTGAAVARGDYLWFLDDDDWILPGALEHFRRLAERSPRSVWLHGGIQVVDESGACLAEVNTGLSGNRLAQIVGGAWVPIQSSVVKADAFFKAGGYHPYICGTEDQDLCRRLALLGDFANTPSAVACLFRGRDWDTSTNYLRAPEDTRVSRDELLAEPGVFPRLLSSVDSSYWHGRVLRVYLSTAIWNLRGRRFSAALSRGLFGVASAAAAGRRLLSRDLWKAVKADHVPDTLHFIVRDLEQRGERV